MALRIGVLAACLCAALLTGAQVDPARLILLRGVATLAEGEARDALADLRQAARLCPEDWRAQLAYGDALCQARETALAMGQLRRAAMLAPLQPEPWQALASAAVTLGDPALAAYARAMGGPEARTSLTLVEQTVSARDAGHLARAAALTEELAATRPETVELLILAGERYLRAGPSYTAQARAITDRLRDHHADNLTAMRGAITLYYDLGDGDAARVMMARYLEPNGPRPVAWGALVGEIARCAADQQQVEEAITILRVLLGRDASYRPAYGQLARLLMQRDAWPEAVALYASALRRWPNDPAFALAQARAALAAGDLAVADTAARQATTRQRGPDAWLVLAAVAHARGDEAAARAAWLTATVMPDGAVRAWAGLLASYMASGETGYAVTALHQLEPALTAAREARAHRLRAHLTAAGLAPTDEEIATLLTLQPDLLDPATVPVYRHALGL